MHTICFPSYFPNMAAIGATNLFPAVHQRSSGLNLSRTTNVARLPRKYANEHFNTIFPFFDMVKSTPFFTPFANFRPTVATRDTLRRPPSKGVVSENRSSDAVASVLSTSQHFVIDFYWTLKDLLSGERVVSWEIGPRPVDTRSS